MIAHDNLGKSTADIMGERYGVDLSGLTYDMWTDIGESFASGWKMSGIPEFFDYLSSVVGIADPYQFIQDYRDLGSALSEEFESTQEEFESTQEELRKEFESTQEELRNSLQDTIETFEKLTESISEFQSKTTTTSSALSLDQQYRNAQRLLEADIQRLYSGDFEKVQLGLENITGTANTFLGISEKMGITSDYSRVMSALNTAQDIGDLYQSRYQGQHDVATGEYTGWDPYGDINFREGQIRDLSMPSFAGGGTISGPDSGYTLPVTFHGKEHVTQDSEMKEVKKELSDMKEVLATMLKVSGNQNVSLSKMNKIFRRWAYDEGSLVVTQAA